MKTFLQCFILCTTTIIIIIVVVLGRAQGEKYTEEDLDVIEALGSSLAIRNYMFVQEHKNMAMAKRLKKFSEDYVLSVVLSVEELETVLNNAAEGRERFDRKAAIVTKDSLNFTRLLQKVSGPQAVFWIFFAKSLVPLEVSYIPTNSYVFVVLSHKGNIVVDKAYHLKPGRKLMRQNLVSWSRDGEKEPDDISISNMYAIDFEEMWMDTLLYMDGEECQKPRPALALDRMECFQHEMVEIIAHKLNFRINNIECPERQFPYNYPNGSLSDLFTILNRKQADLSSASYVITQLRLKYYDFAWPTFTSRSMMYIRASNPKGYWKAYLNPMDLSLWMAIVGWIVAGGVLVQVFHEVHGGRIRFRRSLFIDTATSVLLSLQMFCNQGLHTTSSWCSNRIVCIFTFFLFIVIYQLYSGHLISSLMVFVPHLPFTNFDEFFDDGTYRIMTLQRGYHNYYVKKIVNMVGSKEVMLAPENQPRFCNEAIAMLCTQKNLVFVENRENIAQHVLPCKLIEIPVPVTYQSIGIGFPKNSPYQVIINRELTIFHASGILHRMRRHLFSYTKLRQKEASTEDFEAVTFDQVVSIFVMLLFGMFFSLGVFAAELIWWQVNQRTSQPTKSNLPDALKIFNYSKQLIKMK